MNSVIFIEDGTGGTPPNSMAGSLTPSTDTCVAVGCFSAADGETEFILGDCSEVDPGTAPYFHGELKTPSLRLALRTVVGETILETPVAQVETTISVWLNDLREPDKVIIGID